MRKLQAPLSKAKLYGRLGVCVGLGIAAGPQVRASPYEQHPALQSAQAVPSFTVSVLTGGPTKRSTAISNQLQKMLQMGMEIGPNGEKGLAVRSVPATPGKLALDELLDRPGVDLAVVSINALNEAVRQDRSKTLTKRLAYIMRLPPEDVLILSRRADIRSVSDLAGKIISVGPAQDDTARQATAIFKDLNLEVRFDNREFRDVDAALGSEEIAAVVLLIGNQDQAIELLHTSSNAAARDLHPLALSFDKFADALLLPTTISHEKYPQLVPLGKAAIDSVAVTSALMAVDWPKWSPRYDVLKELSETLFQRFSELRSSGADQQWGDVNLGATLLGWHRFDPAEQWLKEHRRSSAITGFDKHQ